MPDATIPEKIEWRVIEGFPDYEVNESGRVRARTKACKRMVGQEIRPKTCKKDGYQIIALRNSDGRKFLYLARVVAEAFLGPPPSPIHQAAHNDNDNSNNHYLNLAWKTPKENIADQLVHGTRLLGERTSSAKLKTEEVFEIRKSSKSNRHLADEFGVGPSEIRRIKKFERWGHL